MNAMEEKERHERMRLTSIYTKAEIWLEFGKGGNVRTEVRVCSPSCQFSHAKLWSSSPKDELSCHAFAAGCGASASIFLRGGRTGFESFLNDAALGAAAGDEAAAMAARSPNAFGEADLSFRWLFGLFVAEDDADEARCAEARGYRGLLNAAEAEAGAEAGAARGGRGLYGTACSSNRAITSPRSSVGTLLNAPAGLFADADLRRGGECASEWV